MSSGWPELTLANTVAGRRARWDAAANPRVEPGDEPPAGVRVARGARIESKHPAQALTAHGAVVRALAQPPEERRPDGQTNGARAEEAGEGQQIGQRREPEVNDHG